MEKKAGITEYLSTNNGIQGIIKYRYSDFIVNEIDLDEEVVRLTSIDTDGKKDETNEEQEKKIDINLKCPFSEEEIEKLKNLKNSDSIQIPVEKLTKEERREMHKYIRAVFPQLNSETLKSDELQWIKVTFCSDKRRTRVSRKEYLSFVVLKENKSTMEIIEYMSKKLRVKSSIFSFAGTKDKRAITCQKVTVHRLEESRLKNLNKILKNVVIGDIKEVKQPLKLGDLKGNLFKIALRKVKAEDDEIEKSMRSLEEKGFINYFGAQRFGATQVCNSLVGVCLIKSDWVSAVDLILKSRQEENQKLIECRKKWEESKDPKKCLEALGNYSCVERKLLEGLIKFSANNYVAALSLIPRNMRLMYLHAYQSLIWNKVVSKRIQLFYLKVLPGDLFEFQDQIKVVDKESVDKISIWQVVLPLPGFDVKYPQNEISQWYDDFLSFYDLNKESFKHKIRDYSLSGSYRKMVEKPWDLKWSTGYYKNNEDKILLSDLDLIKNEVIEPPKENGFLNKYLSLEFGLPSSSYATMALREVTKEDTSSSNQTLLNSRE